MNQPVETPSAVHVGMEVSKGEPVETAETGNGGTTVTIVASTTVTIVASTTVIKIGNGHATVAMGVIMDQVRTQLIRPKG